MYTANKDSKDESKSTQKIEPKFVEKEQKIDTKKMITNDQICPNKKNKMFEEYRCKKLKKNTNNKSLEHNKIEPKNKNIKDLTNVKN